MAISQKEINDAVRDYCDQIAYGKSASEEDVYTLGYSRFSDENIEMCTESACRLVASMAKSQHLVNLIRPAYPSLPDNFLRLIDDSITAGGNKARRMSYHARMGLSPARGPSQKYPLFQFEDCDLTVEGHEVVSASCVVYPEYRDHVETGQVNGNVLTGGQWNDGDEGTFVRVEDAAGALLFSSTVSQVLNGGSVEVADAAPAAVTGRLTHRKGDTRLMQDALFEAIVARTSELLMMSAQEPMLASVASRKFSESISGFSIGRGGS